MAKCVSTLALVALFVCLGAGTTLAGIYWSESFEYDDSPFDHGWEWDAGMPAPWVIEPPYTSTDQAWTGTRSVRCEGYAGWIVHSFPGDVPATRVSAMFYDDGDWGSQDEAAIWTRWDDNSQFLALAKYMGTGSNYYVFDGAGSHSTPVPMSMGWHLFEWVQESGSIDLYIDSTYCMTYSGTTLSAVGVGAGEVGMYADDIKVYAPSTPGQMVFSGCNPMRQTPGLFVSDPDGGNVVRALWAAPPGEWECMMNPDWSPNGIQVVLTYRCQMAVLDFCCTLPWPEPFFREPTIIRDCGRNARWSPTGDRIAFFSEDGLAVVNPDGTEYRVLVLGADGAPTWSADGLSIVYGGANVGTYDLWQVTGIDDPTPTVVQLTDTPAVTEMTAALGPDGSELAYSESPAVGDWTWTDPLPAAGIRVVDYPGMTTVRVLTDDPDYCDRVSSWSPDAEHIYFVREEATWVPRESRLWRVKADGSEPEEPVPGLAEWDSVVGGPSFLKSGVYTSASYAVPGYTNVPVSMGIVKVQNLAGFQADLQFKGCCEIVETVDSCLPGLMVDHWAFLDPNIDQDAGWVKALAYAGNPELDRVSGSGELLNLAASMTMYGVAASDEGIMPFGYNDLQLSDDWGDPIDMPMVIGGLALKPLSSLELSEVPVQVWADYEYAVPFELTVAAMGDMDELLPWFGKAVELFVEMPDPDNGYPTLYREMVSPTSVALADGVWTGDVSILGPVRAPARLLARYKDWGGRSNTFSALLKGDVSGDGIINVFDVIKVANIAIERGTWTASELWASDFNGNGEVNIFDVIEAANAAMDAMESMGIGRAGAPPVVAPPSEPVTVTTDVSTSGSQVVVAVKLSNCAGLAGVQVELEYDTKKLAYSGVSAGDLLTGASSWSVMGNDLGGAVKAIAYTASAEVLSGGDGTILTFTFNQTGKGKAKVDVTSVELADVEGEEIASQTSAGKGGGKGKAR